jgi:polyhydroxyalkanoate synthesis regulator phasin
MTKKIIWRLKESPTTEKLSELVKNGILTKDEAREILFSSVEESERSIESLKEEIKFLRDMIDKLSSSRSQVVEVIKTIEVPYRQYPWYQPYITWCGGTGGTATDPGSVTFTASGNNLYVSDGSNSFNSIQTF